MFTAGLECGHALTFESAPPAEGETLWCFPCAEYRVVVSAPYDYVVKCRTCTYRVRVEEAEADARIMKHQNRHPTHRMALYHSGVAIARYDAPDKSLEKSFAKLLRMRGIGA